MREHEQGVSSGIDGEVLYGGEGLVGVVEDGGSNRIGMGDDGDGVVGMLMSLCFEPWGDAGGNL